ncbi:MAG: hypothetical protein H0U46_08010 [Actinobacteria bacterium]|nr:hypothetical protein [Actinomycetota bacterium]
MARVSAIGSEYVNLVLTVREAKMLWRAAGELLENTAALEAFPDGHDRAAAFRAQDALGRGWALAARGKQ